MENEIEEKKKRLEKLSWDYTAASYQGDRGPILTMGLCGVTAAFGALSVAALCNLNIDPYMLQYAIASGALTALSGIGAAASVGIHNNQRDEVYEMKQEMNRLRSEIAQAEGQEQQTIEGTKTK